MAGRIALIWNVAFYGAVALGGPIVGSVIIHTRAAAGPELVAATYLLILVLALFAGGLPRAVACEKELHGGLMKEDGTHNGTNSGALGRERSKCSAMGTETQSAACVHTRQR